MVGVKQLGIGYNVACGGRDEKVSPASTGPCKRCAHGEVYDDECIRYHARWRRRRRGRRSRQVAAQGKAGQSARAMPCTSKYPSTCNDLHMTGACHAMAGPTVELWGRVV